MEEAQCEVDCESATRLSDVAFDEFKKALAQPMPQQLQELLSRKAEWL